MKIPIEKKKEIHFRQLEPIQVGFSGNMILAMSIVSSRDMTLKNIDIHDLESETGLVFGTAIWTHVKNITFSENINLYNFNAGSQVEVGTLSYSDRPNKAPEACAFKIQWETTIDDVLVEDYNTEIINYKDVSNWIICNIQGHVYCDGDDQYTTESSITYDESLCSSFIEKNNMKKLAGNNLNHEHFYFNSIVIMSSLLITTLILMCVYKRYKVEDVHNELQHNYTLIHKLNKSNYGSIQINNNQVV